MRASILICSLFVVAALAAPAFAGERIEFTNGHTIIVKSSEIRGEKVILTFEDGSEIGFPKAMVKNVDGNVRNPRNSARNRVRAIRGGGSQGARPVSGASGVARRGSSEPLFSFSGSRAGVGYGESITVGYQRKGKTSVRDLVRAMRPSPDMVSVGSIRSTPSRAEVDPNAQPVKGDRRMSLDLRVAPKLPSNVK